MCVCVCARATKPTVHRHLINLGAVVLLDISQDTDVVVLDEINGHTLPTVPSRATDSERICSINRNSTMQED